MRVAQTRLSGLQAGSPAEANAPLPEVPRFGSNPGALRMFCHVPASLPAKPALVVVLHGCMQTAAGYNIGSGWSTLADRKGFVLLFPMQQRANNPNGCFNWFQPGDIARGQGEARSIREMIERMITDHDIDRSRIFITGLSAGGAMTSVLLATYPEVFAGGAIIAGLPYGAAKGVPEALASMKQCPVKSPRAWGDLVRSASAHRSPWPKISVWHGAADLIVTPSSTTEILKQWSDLHGLPLAATAAGIVKGHPREVWRNAAGEEVIESYRITGMAHGTPLATGDGEDQGGVAAAFLLDVGISSTYHIARFWGLTERRDADRVAARMQTEPTDAMQSEPNDFGGKPMREENDGAALPIDVGAIITRALKAAGLMKTP
jgi:feruloyl esterase